MTNEQEPRHDRHNVASRLDAFNSFMRRMPEWAYWSVVFAVGVVGVVVYLLVAAQ